MTNSSNLQTVQTDFLRYKQTNFMDLIKTGEQSVGVHESGELDKRLLDDFERTTKTEKYTKMFQFRQKLPSYNHKEEIVDLVKTNKVVLIAGNTGCGKTTQVGQYILDNALMNMEGSKTKIVCTQPRRIAGMIIMNHHFRRVFFVKKPYLKITSSKLRLTF